MSYINFSITRAATNPGAAIAQATDTLQAGFSREGGRLEFVEHTSASHGALPPFTKRFDDTAGFEAAGSGLLSAIKGAGWVQDIVVTQPDARRAGDVTWSYRNGGPAGHAPSNAVPTDVQAVIDAAAKLDRATHAKLTVPFVKD